jgi:acetoin utilization deacetylase AcuC-like enzyme
VSTGLVTDARFHAHVAPWEHPERPERLASIERAIDAAGLRHKTVKVTPRAATRAELERVHSPTYLDALEAAIGHGGSGWLDSDTYYCDQTWTAALLAAGASVELCEQISSGKLDNGFAFVRPPGHHATRDRAMGFCLLNNVAVAAAHLHAQGKRVAILDWDVHHGNGTEAIFDEEPEVLYVSTHEWPQYPGTGPALHTGSGRGVGTKVNVPLPARTSDAAYLRAYDAKVKPAIESFKPDFIIVSAGFDAHHDDPIGGLQLTEDSYVTVTRHLMSVQPRLAMVLEGGYDLGAIARSSVATLQAMIA